MSKNSYTLVVPRADIERHPLAAPGWAGARLRHEPQADLAAMLVLCAGLVGTMFFAGTRGSFDPLQIQALCVSSWFMAFIVQDLVLLQGWYGLRKNGMLRDLLLADTDPVVTYAAYWHRANPLCTWMRMGISTILTAFVALQSGEVDPIWLPMLAISASCLGAFQAWSRWTPGKVRIVFRPETVDKRQMVWKLGGIMPLMFPLMMEFKRPFQLMFIFLPVAFVLMASVVIVVVVVAFPAPNPTPIARDVLEAFAFDQREELARLLKVGSRNRPKD